MSLVTLESWTPVGGVMKRRGRPDKNSQYVAFAYDSGVKPLGYKDEAAGLGTRNVGPRLSSYTTYSGDYTVTAGMGIISGLHITGRIIGRGAGPTDGFVDCIIDGQATAVNSDDGGALPQSYNFGGISIQWCRIEILANNGWTDAIKGGGYAMKYCELYGGVDGGGANAVGSASIECSRIAYGYYDSWWNTSTGSVRTSSYTDAGGRTHPTPFPAQSSGDVHSDGIQIQQYSGWKFRGNNTGGLRTVTSAGTHLDPTVTADYNKILAMRAAPDYVNSAMIMSSASASFVTGGEISYNWLTGGQARLNIACKTYDHMAGWNIHHNRVVRSSYGYDFYIQNGAIPTLANNVYDDDGTPVTVTYWGTAP